MKRPRHSAIPLALVVLSLLAPLQARAVPAITAVRVASNLAFPAGFTVFPDSKRLLYGERWTGELRIYNTVTGTDTLFFTIPDVPGPGTESGRFTLLHFEGGEEGLLGIALHPDYPVTPYVYAYVTRELPSGGHENQIVRITDVGGRGTEMTVLFRVPSSPHHIGGRILFGPDRMLYVVIGDRTKAANAQDPTTRTGKVLRMTPTGGIPADNPFAGRYTFAYGIRNSFGLAFDPVNGRLWETENGPTCNDEINRIDRGRNYGWGRSWTCSTPPAPPRNTNRDGPSPVMPIRWFTPPTAPTGVAFCDGCALGADSETDMFVAEFNTGHVRRFQMGPSRWSVSGQQVVYTHPSARIVSMERAPDGTLFFSDTGGIYRLALTS